MYQSEQKAGSVKTWQEFLCETALRAKVKESPYLLERREDMDLPESIKERLYMNQVMVLADLAQLTKESLEGIPGFTKKELTTLYSFLEKKGLSVISCDKPVFFVFYPDTREGYDKVITHIHILMHEADDYLNNPKDLTCEEALKKAVAMYEEAINVAKENEIDALNLRELVGRYTNLLTDYYQFGTEFVEKGEKYLLWKLSLTQEVFGPRHSLTGQVCRKIGAFYIQLHYCPLKIQDSSLKIL